MHGGSTAVWYLMRSTGIVSVVLLTAVMALGIATTNRWAPPSTPRFVTAALHRSISLLSVVFVGIHVVTAVVDPYASALSRSSFRSSAPAIRSGSVSAPSRST